METIPLERAQKKLPELSRCMSEHRGGELYVITDKGHPTMVVMSYDQWQALEETVEIQADEDLMSALRRSAEDIAAGRLVPKERADELIGW